MSSNVLQHQKIGFVQDPQPVSVETLSANFNFCLDYPKIPGVVMGRWCFALFFLIFICQWLKHTPVLADLMEQCHLKNK